MGFADEVRQFAEDAKRKTRQVFTGCVTEVHESVTDGSSVTGAPGQPVDTGNLIRSWGPTFPSPLVGEVVTNVSYAQAIEDGEIRAHTRSAHTRGPYTRSDGTEVAAHEVQEHQVAGRTINFRSDVGGAHSVKLTRAGWPKIVDHVVEGVTRG